MAETKPGDGKTNPFGNGSGGSNMASGSGNDFTRNPGGSTPKAGGPGVLAQSRPQKTGEEEFRNKDSIPEGGPLPFAGNTTDNQTDAGNPVGTGSGGSKPFKLDGG